MHNITSPRTDDSAIEQEIKAKGLTAPRVTPADLEANIAYRHFFTAEQAVFGKAAWAAWAADADLPVGRVVWGGSTGLNLLTFCVLVLKNGFTVTGESACASPENFDAEIGKKIALENAKQKIWPLMGYALKESLA
jgi:hypothetical protein